MFIKKIVFHFFPHYQFAILAGFSFCTFEAENKTTCPNSQKSKFKIGILEPKLELFNLVQ